LVLVLFVLATWLHLVTFKSCGCCLFGGLLGLGRVLLGFGNLAAPTVVVFETCRCCLLGGLSVLVLVLFVLATRLHLVRFNSCGCCLHGGLLGLGPVLLGFGNLAAPSDVQRLRLSFWRSFGLGPGPLRIGSSAAPSYV